MDIMVQLNDAYCRICAASNAVDHCMYEQGYGERTLSIHMMMQKLVPSVFNVEQTKVDELLCWPKKICENCKNRALEAYEFYELCLRSGDLLRECYSRKVNSPVIDTGTSDALKTSAKAVMTPRRSLRTRTSPKKVVVEETPLEEIVLQLDTEEAKEDTALKLCSDFIENRDTNQLEYEEIIVLPTSEQTPSELVVQTQELPRKATRQTKKRSQPKASRVNVSKNAKARGSTDPKREQTEEQPAKVIQFHCLLCDEGVAVYDSPTKLTDHLKSAHAGQILTCDKCPKVFMTEQTMQHHQFCHATGQSFFCAYCDKGFQTERLLENHVRTHTSTGFLCSVCGKEFSDRSNLRQHEYRHTGDKPWVCSQCPSRFSTKGYLTVHLHTHTKAKRFSCTTCGSQFSRHYSLVKHQVIHTGERHYACEVCKTRFASAHHVKIHMRTHTGEKPYKCVYCGRGFAQKNDMLKHTKTHGKPYPCDRCDASFPQLVDLRNHLKQHDQDSKRDESASSSAEQ
uniref:Zinc finger protein 865 n=1 Tax=Anopheles farauti TaxID=69004 RepID=A0A182Q5T1_9DIPT